MLRRGGAADVDPVRRVRRGDRAHVVVVEPLGVARRLLDYAASNGALDTLGTGLAKEVVGEGIRVNTVRPGVIDTDIHADSGRPDRVDDVGESLPMGRAGRPEEVAAVVLWLLGDASSYVTGSILDVTGGK